MKLILCTKCSDVFKIESETRKCKCGYSVGRYTDNINAIYYGNYAKPLGIVNSSLVEAVHNQPKEGLGERFVAFVIPKECDTMIKVTKKEYQEFS